MSGSPRCASAALVLSCSHRGAKLPTAGVSYQQSARRRCATGWIPRHGIFRTGLHVLSRVDKLPSAADNATSILLVAANVLLDSAGGQRLCGTGGRSFQVW